MAIGVGRSERDLAGDILPRSTAERENAGDLASAIHGAKKPV